MKDKLDKFIHSRLFVIILILVLIVTTAFVGTYAWFTWSNPEDQNTIFTMSIGNIADVTFGNGNAIDGQLTPVYNYYDGLSTSFDINNKVSDSNVNCNIIFNITSIDNELISEQVKYVVLSNDDIVSEGDLSTASSGGSLTLYSGELPKNISNHKVYFYLDGNNENDLSMIGKSISGHIMVETYELAATYITNLYLNNNPTEIINYLSYGGENARYYYSYMDEGNTWGLMNDGLGATVTDTTALINARQGNIRYFGASPNNYIYFNCDDYNNQYYEDENTGKKNCERWRIIGVFDNKLKIIRSEPIGDYSWDYTSTGAYNNNWHDSTLMTLLNTGYYNNSDGVKYYNMSTTPITINFKTDNKGLKNTETQKMISESTWYLGGYDSSERYVDNMYGYERGDTKCSSCTYDTIWTGKIALMYPSDYGYAADLSKCNYNLANYNYAKCNGTDWLFNGNKQWLLTPYSSGSYQVWEVGSFGPVASSASVSYDNRGVSPVLYLSSELVIEAGEGTIEKPYELG